MIALDSPLNGEFTGSEPPIGNFKSFRYFASDAVFCFPGFAPDSSGARNRGIGVAGRYTSGTGPLGRVDSSGNKGPFRLDGGRHRRYTRTIRAIGPEAVTP